ncbi:MAG: DUF433 domain-containing protein [Bacteroidota bacterium]
MSTEIKLLKLELLEWLARQDDPKIILRLVQFRREMEGIFELNEPQAVYEKLPKRAATLENLITVDPEIVSGTPVFAGTRVPVQSLFDWLETETLEEFLDNFPSVSKEQALQVLHYAEQLLLTQTTLDEITA